MLDLCVMYHSSRVVFRVLFLSSTLRSKIEKPETKQHTFGKQNETKKELIGNGRIIIIGIELHQLYSLQRLLH